MWRRWPPTVNAELDAYLHIQAGHDLRRKVAAPFVMLDQTGAVVGYYTNTLKFPRPCSAGWQSAASTRGKSLAGSY